MANNTTGKRGFAAMDTSKQKEIASKGGKASPTNFANRPKSEVKRLATEGGRNSHRT
ncbi:MAG: KGG domain-containing protein [Candidatus Saccharimonadales bacterium]